jgi:hypothetical protein
MLLMDHGKILEAALSAMPRAIRRRMHQRFRHVA